MPDYAGSAHVILFFVILFVDVFIYGFQAALSVVDEREMERRQEDPDQTSLAEELAAFRRMARGAAFAMYVRDVFDLGNGDTGLVGYLLGTAAVGNTACLYERTGGYQLSEPVPVKSLVYERTEQSTLASADQLLPCGVVIGGRYKPQKIRGEILIEWSKMM